MNKLKENGHETDNLHDAKDYETFDPSGNSVSNDLFVKVVTENYAKYIKKCYSYLKCTSLAEDAVQEGILAAHGNLGSIRNNKVLGAWLNQIIVRKAIDLLRKNKKFLLFDDDMENLVSYNKQGVLNSPFWSEITNVEDKILEKEGLDLVKKSLESLNDIYRIPLLLKDYEEFSIKDISEILQISQSNVKIRIHRARIKLKIELSGYFFPEQTKEIL